MLIISVWGNENNKWKRKRKKPKTKRNNDVAQAIVKVWELNDFAVHLS